MAVRRPPGRSRLATGYVTGSSTIREQLAANHALTDPDEEHFVRQLIDSPDAAVGTDPRELAPRAAVVSYPRVGWDGLLAGRAPADTVLDARRADEFIVSRMAGAVKIPLDAGFDSAEAAGSRIDYQRAPRGWISSSRRNMNRSGPKHWRAVACSLAEYGHAHSNRRGPR